MSKSTMPTQYNVDTLAPQHALALKTLEENLFSTSWSEAQFMQALATNHFLAYGIFVKQILVAYCTAYHLEDELEIVNIGVDTAFRKQGLATQLLGYTITVAKRRNLKRILLEVRQTNTPAKELYAKFDFVQIGVRKNYYTDTNEDALLLNVSLTQ